jgi:predicted ArsR family transcriptional regulator
MAEITRQDFVKCCAMGVCSALVPVTASASADDGDSAELKWQLDAARLRYAKFLDVLNQEVDPATKKKILRSLGRQCAQQYRSATFDKYKGDIKGFLKAVQPGWFAKAEYDEKAGLIRIVDRATKCACPLVQQGVTSGDQCQCTLGWQEETYSRILGRPVEAELEESILRGGRRCVYVVRIL